MSISNKKLKQINKKYGKLNEKDREAYTIEPESSIQYLVFHKLKKKRGQVS